MPREDLSIIIGADTGHLGPELARAAGMFRAFAKGVEASKPKAFGLPDPPKAAAFKAATFSVRGLGHATRETAGYVAGFARDVATTGLGVALAQAGINGLSAAMGQLKEAVVKAGDLEQTTIAFETLLKSGDAARQMIGDIRQFAATTPFNSRELTQSARGLMAYGVAAEQVVPTLRMLGDVSATFGKDLPLSRLTYLYGTLFAQRRAYTVDIKQFAMAGIPIWDELAKVTGKAATELQALVEEGRIGRDEVTKAFINMTAAGGRFAGMTARQAKSLHGLWEAASDSWDMLRTKFGQVVVDETGLKDVFQNLDGFFKRLMRSLDAPDSTLRKVIRFMGDLAKAVAQVGYEFARAGFQTIGIWIRQLDSVLPEAKRAFETLRTIIEDAGNFKLDPVKVARFAVAAGQSLITGGAAFVHAIGAGAKILRENFINPLMTAVGELARFIQSISFKFKPREAFDEFWFDFRYPNEDSTPESLVRNWRKIIDEQIRIENLHENDPRRMAWQGKLRRIERDYVDSFIFDPQARAKLAKGIAPNTQFQTQAAVTIDGFDLERFGNKILQGAKVLEAAGQNIIDAIDQAERQRRVAEYEADYEARLAAARRTVWAGQSVKNMARGGDFPAMPVPLPGLDVLSGLAGAVALHAKQERFGTLRAILGVLPAPFGSGGAIPGLAGSGGAFPGIFGRPQEGGGVKLQGDFPQHLLELQKRLLAEYRPLNAGPDVMNIRDALRGTELGQKRDDLFRLLATKRIDVDLYEKAWGKEVRAVAERFGIGGQTQLPGSVLVGSQEDAQLLARFAAGNQQQTTEDLLRQLVELTRQMLGIEKAREVAPMPRLVEFRP